jgi:hypothetical protein
MAADFTQRECADLVLLRAAAVLNIFLWVPKVSPKYSVQVHTA